MYNDLHMSESRIFDILDAVLDLPAAQRPAYLDRSCDGDHGLRRQLDALVAAAQRADGFLRTADEAATPEQIGRYRIRSEVGRGASGVVYLAEDPTLRRPIALKTFPPGWSADARRCQRLREEALALASVTQANVTHVYTFEENAESGAGPRAFVTMEFVEGETLAERLRRGPLDLETALETGRQIAAGLEAAHRVGIIHRDLKPQNVRITPEGWVKVLDFGLATSVPEIEGSREALPLQGTPGYMSPEQIEGRELDSRCDLWALGCVLFEVLTATPAIEGSRLDDLLERTRRGEVAWPRLHAACRSLGRGPSDDGLAGTGDDTHRAIVGRVEALIAQCLRVDPSERPSSPSEVRRILDEELLRIRSAPFAPFWSLASGPVRGPDRAAAGRLPTLRGTFIGREQVLKDLDAACAESRLVTITGPGGAGKTRTILEFVSHRHLELPDTVWFLDLAAVSHAPQITEAMAQLLEMHDLPDGDLEASVRERLRDQTALLVVDNCEHLIEAIAQVLSGLLESCPELRIVATSREPLRLSEERLILLGPMAVPEPGASGEVAVNEAVRLFAARACAYDPGFVLDEARARLTAVICRQLDGLPLAIELAAAKTRALSLEELSARIGQDSAFLASGTRDREDRHRSLEHLIEWSFRLLDDTERTVFLALSVLRGGFGLAAAEAVCSFDDVAPWDVCGTLAGLVEKSLVQADATGPRVRYRFLETVRDFAARRLDRHLVVGGTPAREAVEDRLVAFYVAESAPRGSESGWTDTAWMRRIQADHVNLRHAFEIACSRRRPAEVFALAVALVRRSMRLGYWRQCLDTAEEALALEAQTSDATGPARPDDLVEVLAIAAQGAAVLDDSARAEVFLGQGMSIAQGHAHAAGLARMYSAAGVVDYYRARLDDADRWLEQAEALHRELGDAAGLAVDLADRARIRSVSGLHDWAWEYYEQALPLHREVRDRAGETRVLVNLGRTAFLRRDHELARQYLEEALAAHRSDGDTHGMVVCLTNLGDLARDADGDFPRALECYREAIDLRVRSGQKSSLVTCLFYIAGVAARMGRDTEAATLLSGVRQAYRTHQLVLYAAIEDPMRDLQSDLESRMDAAEFARAWSEGAACSVPQLVEFVERAF